MENDNFESSEHALLVGSLLGAFMTNQATVLPEIDEQGDYLPRVRVQWELGTVGYEVVLEVPMATATAP